MIISIDGSFLLHRARFVAGKNGTPTRDHTISIFMSILLRTLGQFRPSKVYIYFDRERSYHRLKLYAAYKGHRKEDENDLTLVAYKLARDFLTEKLPKLGFITVLRDGIEADDFGYITAYKYAPGVHVTDDRDWFNNLFPNWSLFRPKANEFISYEQFCRMVSHTDNPRMIYLIARAITGDRSDNIPGIRGVPWEQALRLAPDVFARKELGHDKYAKKVREGMDLVRYNMNIMTPIWVIQSGEVLDALREAENEITRDFSSPLILWKSFYERLEEEEPQRDMKRLVLEYKSLVKRLSYE